MRWVLTVVLGLGGNGEEETELTSIFDGDNFNKKVIFFLGDDFGTLGERAGIVIDSPRGVGRRNPGAFDWGKLRGDPLFQGGERVATDNGQLHNRGGVILLVEFKQTGFHVDSETLRFLFEGEKVSCSEVGKRVFFVHLRFQKLLNSPHVILNKNKQKRKNINKISRHLCDIKKGKPTCKFLECSDSIAFLSRSVADSVKRGATKN